MQTGVGVAESSVFRLWPIPFQLFFAREMTAKARGGQARGMDQQQMFAQSAAIEQLLELSVDAYEMLFDSVEALFDTVEAVF